MVKRALLTDVDRRRLGTLLGRADAQAVGRPRWRHRLERKTEEAECVACERTPRTLVTMNSTLVLLEPGSNRRRTVTLVYPDDQDLAPDGVSVLQELGCLLLGRRVGDTVVVTTAGKRRRYVIEALLFQPEAAGAYSL